MTAGKGDDRRLVETVRETLAPYGRDYAIGVLHGLAVRNMISVRLPEVSPGFYPIVKVHEIALREIEDIFYAHLEEKGDHGREKVIALLVEEKIWE